VRDGDTKIPEHYAGEIALFFRGHDRWLFGFACVRTCRDQERAADLVQDTFEAATLAWGTLRELSGAQQRAWLRTTLSNKDVSNFRRGALFRRKQPDLHHRYQVAEADTEQQALSALALERAAKIIEGLPGKQKKIALMRWNDHMKVPEIAEVLGCSAGAVGAQLTAIRRKLIAGLGPYYPFGKDDGEGAAS